MKWKDKTQMHLNMDHAFLNDDMHKQISMFSRPWYDTYWQQDWEINDLGFKCNWFNQNIKSLNNIEFDIKSQTLNIFQLQKKWNIYIIFKIKNYCD